MKTSFAGFITIVSFAVFAAVGNAQTTAVYYSSDYRSVVNPGQTVFVDLNALTFPHSTIGSVCDEPMTELGINMGYVDPVTKEGFSIQFNIPLTSMTTSIRDQTYSFNDKSWSDGGAPRIDFEAYKFAVSNVGFDYFVRPEVVSGTFIVAGLDMVNGTITSATILGTLTEDTSANGPIKDYLGIWYQSDYPITGLQVAAIPEPSTYAALLGMAALGCVFVKCRKVVSTIKCFCQFVT